jgi:transcriptional regulator with XRE-family HTH domain
VERNVKGIGPMIQRLREEKGWTQAELGVYAHLGASTVSLLESGKRKASARTLSRLAEALGVEVGDLFPKEEALRLPLDIDESRYDDFKFYLRALDLDGLQRLGTELREDHRQAVEEDDLEKAADLYSRRVLLGKQIEELDPPLATITLRRDGPVEVAFYREPSETELKELQEKYPGYVVVASPVTVQRPTKKMGDTQ